MTGFVVAVVLAGLVVLVNGQEEPDCVQKIRQNKGACIAESGVDKALVEKLHSIEAVDDTKLKCFIKCLYTKSGVVSQAGEFNMEELKRTLLTSTDQEKFSEVIGNCESLKGSDACGTVYKVSQCMFGV